MTNKKGNILIIVLQLTALITVGILGFVFWKYSQKQTPPTNTPAATPTANLDTVNWKTYTNNQYGYTLQYPSNWFLENNILTSYDTHPPPPYNPNFFKNYTKIDLGWYKLVNKSLDSDLSQIERENIKIMGTKISEKTKTTINTRSALKVIWQDIHTPSNINTTYYIESNDGTYIVLTVYGSYVEKNMKTIDQILSTFKFIDNEKEPACELDREYEESKNSKISCVCPTGYTFKTTSVGPPGACSTPEMTDCPTWIKMQCKRI